MVSEKGYSLSLPLAASCLEVDCLESDFDDFDPDFDPDFDDNDPDVNLRVLSSSLRAGASADSESESELTIGFDLAGFDFSDLTDESG